MIIKHATQDQIREALSKISPKYNFNLKFRERTPEPIGKANFRVRLGVKNSHGKGASIHQRYNFFDGTLSERHLRSACWHVHGNFFDALFELCPDALVYARGNKITASQGNWQDYDVGSQLFPVMASDSCDCW